MKKFLICLLMISSSVFAMDVNINGTYFSPAQGAVGTFEYEEAYLSIMKDGVITDFDIINGALLVDTTTYSIKGNVITHISGENLTERTYDCNGEEVVVGPDEPMPSSIKATVEKDSNGLTVTVSFGGQSESLTVRNATAEEVSSTLALPRCTLK